MTSDPDIPPVGISSADQVSQQFDTEQVFERYGEDDPSRDDGSEGGRRARAGGGPQPGVDDGAADSSDIA